MGSVRKSSKADGKSSKKVRPSRRGKNPKAGARGKEVHVKWEPLSPEQIEEIATGMHDGSIFSSDFIPVAQQKQMLAWIFFPLSFISDKELKDMKENQVTMFAAHSKTGLGTWCMNGFAMHTEAIAVRRDDHLKIMARYDEIEKAMFPNGRPKQSAFPR